MRIAHTYCIQPCCEPKENWIVPLFYLFLFFLHLIVFFLKWNSQVRSGEILDFKCYKKERRRNEKRKHSLNSFSFEFSSRFSLFRPSTLFIYLFTFLFHLSVCVLLLLWVEYFVCCLTFNFGTLCTFASFQPFMSFTMGLCNSFGETFAS